MFSSEWRIIELGAVALVLKGIWKTNEVLESKIDTLKKNYKAEQFLLKNNLAELIL